MSRPPILPKRIHVAALQHGPRTQQREMPHPRMPALQIIVFYNARSRGLDAEGHKRVGSASWWRRKHAGRATHARNAVMIIQAAATEKGPIKTKL